MDELKPDKDVKVLLDGDGKAGAESTPAILDTRPATCAQHGDYIDQKIPLRTYQGLKPVLMPYWLGCPACRREAELANKLEEKHWSSWALIPADPSNRRP